VTHVVKQGEHLSTIASEYGFCHYETVWNDPGNDALRAKRDNNPNVLNPGDEVFIPEKIQKTQNVVTTKVHVFRVRMQTLRLILVLRDVNGIQLANSPCELDVDGKVTKLTTDGNGKIDRPIPITAKGGKVTSRGFEYPFLIGHLDPVDTESGQRARLANLGYYLGSSETHDPIEFQSAVEEFQCDHALDVDGICGQNTQKKLKEVHRS
jgi:hypothetical protein